MRKIFDFKPVTDHGLNLPEGAEVLGVDYGGRKVCVWEERDHPFWGRDAEGKTALIGTVDKPLWNIASGISSTAGTLKMAKHLAEKYARETYAIGGAEAQVTDNLVTREDIAEHEAALEAVFSEMRGRRAEWEAENVKSPDDNAPEPC